MFNFLATHGVVQLLDPFKMRDLLYDGVLACNPAYLKYFHDLGFAQSLKAYFTTGLQLAKVSNRPELMVATTQRPFLFIWALSR